MVTYCTCECMGCLIAMQSVTDGNYMENSPVLTLGCSEC